MFKGFSYEKQIDEKFKSFSALLYCQLTGNNESKMIRFLGRTIDFTLVLGFVNLVAFKIIYSSTAGFLSSLVYIFAGSVVASFVIYAVDYYLALNKKLNVIVVLFLAVAIPFFIVVYAVSSMKGVASSLEETSFNEASTNSDVKELYLDFIANAKSLS